MKKELEFWQFSGDRLQRGENLMLLIVAESSGSSPGRAGYKMAVASDGELCGSIGGGVMEVNLVDQSREILSVPGGLTSFAKSQVHRRDVENSSGMICSGKQTVIFKLLMPENLSVVHSVIAAIRGNDRDKAFRVTPVEFELRNTESGKPNLGFDKLSEIDFRYEEKLGFNENLYIIGGGHCALALSELMSKLDFRITIRDDRPELNTIEKNEFADEIRIIDNYEWIVELNTEVSSYVVVMTLGYASDKIAIKAQCGRKLKYFGVLGSKAKMATLMKELKHEGIPEEHLARIRAPIGIPINSHTPEEIAVSIAAEIISVKNSSE